MPPQHSYRCQRRLFLCDRIVKFAPLHLTIYQGYYCSTDCDIVILQINTRSKASSRISKLVPQKLLLGLGRTDVGTWSGNRNSGKGCSNEEKSSEMGQFMEEPIYILMDLYELKEGQLPLIALSPLVSLVALPSLSSLPRGCQSSDKLLAKESSPPYLKTRNLPLEI